MTGSKAETDTDTEIPPVPTGEGSAPTTDARLTAVEQRQDEQWRTNQNQHASTLTALETINQSLTKMEASVLAILPRSTPEKSPATETAQLVVKPVKLPKSAVGAEAGKKSKQAAALLAKGAKKVTFI